MENSVQLFPYHFDTIVDAAKSVFQAAAKTKDDSFEKVVTGLREKHSKSIELYNIVYHNNLTFFQRHKITLKKQFFVPITDTRKEELKKHMGTFILKIHQGNLSDLGFYYACLKGDPNATTRIFRDAVFPKMVKLIEDVLKEYFPVESKEYSSYGPLIETRRIFGQFTTYLETTFLKQEKELLNSVFEAKRLTHSTIPLFDLFEELLKQLVVGGELAYYRALVSEGNDVIFF